jgi:hypothetical protein
MTGRLGRHFAACAVVAATAAQHAAADVNYWPDANLVVPANIDGLYINVETRTTGTSGASTPGWDINPYSATSLTWFNATGTGMLRFPGVTTGSAGSLDLNTPVGASGSYGAGAVTVGSAPGNWRLNSENFFAFRFTASDGLTHYGWGKFVIGSAINGTDRTITELAWETEAGTPILVGNTGGPPPDYDPCAPFNPTAGVGTNSLPMNLTTSDSLDMGACDEAYKANYFRFVAPTSGIYTISTCAVSDTKLAVLDGCATGSTQLGCNDNGCGTGATLTLTLAGGSTYYIVVGGDTDATALPTTMTVQVDAPPIEACTTAPAVLLGANPFTNDGQTIDQTVQATTAGGTTIIYKASWHKFTPGVNGLYTFSLCGSVNDTKMAIGTACPTVGQTFQSLAYNDDTCACSSGCGTTTQSNWSSTLGEGQTTGILLNTELSAGQAYYIVIGGFGATTAAVSGNLEVTGPPQPNCPADLNDDGFVDGNDLGILLGQWGPCPTPCSADFNGDNFVDGNDLGVLLAAWGACP